MKNLLIYYSVGALLYCPANRTDIVQSVAEGRFGSQYSLALCLEDTIGDDFVSDAEQTLIASLNTLLELRKDKSFFFPKIFIRVRSALQIIDLWNRLRDARECIVGFIIPKFSLDNADTYISVINRINQESFRQIYMMPIMESPTIISLETRYNVLYALREKLDKIQELVLNIRVGGNDLCHLFGFRRHCDESIHRMRPIADIFSDIVTVFGMDYVISGPVWEYYDGEGWDSGLKEELLEDKLCGFIGKTVIHPKQIALVNEAYKVTDKDVQDAKAILNWNTHASSFVSGSISKERMNEYKTHFHWAKKVILLSQAFGVK